MIVTVTPNPSVDRTYLVDALKPGALHRAREARAEASGKGVNVSRVLVRLGAPTRAVVTAGGGEGRLLTDLLAASGLTGTVAVPVAGPTRVNVTLVADGAEPTKVNEPGTALSPDEADRLVTLAAALLRAPSPPSPPSPPEASAMRPLPPVVPACALPPGAKTSTPVSEKLPATLTTTGSEAPSASTWIL
jgi:sugar/nucleoside kinase (ribokinase family)